MLSCNEAMVDEVEVDLEDAACGMDRGRAEAAGGDIQRAFRI